MLTAMSTISPTFDAAVRAAFGDPQPAEEKDKFDIPPYDFRPSNYSTRRRLARCPRCKTVARHRVETAVQLQHETSSTLECVWCWGLFKLAGNSK